MSFLKNDKIGTLLTGVGILITMVILYTSMISADATAKQAIARNTSDIKETQTRMYHIDKVVIENNIKLNIIEKNQSRIINILNKNK